MALVAHLRPYLDQGFALHQPLLQFSIDTWWWRPRLRLEPVASSTIRIDEAETPVASSCAWSWR